MKQIRIAIYLLLFTCLALSDLRAQSRGTVTLKADYAVGIPMGSFKSDAVNDISWRGFTAALLCNVGRRFSVGVASGFQDYYQKYPRQVYNVGNGDDVSAVLSYSIQTVPVLAEGKFAFTSGTSLIRPYIGVGVGGNIITYRRFFGEFDLHKDEFKFAVAPEAGICFVLDRYSGLGLNIAAVYNYMPFMYDGLDNLSNLTAKAGINLPLR